MADHKHRLKFEVGKPYFLHFRCRDEDCDKEYIISRFAYNARLHGFNNPPKPAVLR